MDWFLFFKNTTLKYYSSYLFLAATRLHCCVQASQCGDFSCCRVWAQQLQFMGLTALQHVVSSWTRAQTHIPCTGKQIPNHWTTREVPQYYSSWLWHLPLRLFSMFPVHSSISSIQHSAGHIVVLNKYWKNEWMNWWQKETLHPAVRVPLTQAEPGARWHQDEGLLALLPRRWNCALPLVWSYLSKATRDFPSPNQCVEF